MTMPRRGTSRPRSRRGKATPTTWWNVSSGNNLTGPGVSNRLALVDPNSAGLPATFEAGLTVVRTILRVIIRSDSLNQFNLGSYGLAVRTGTAVIDVILSLLDWYLHQNWENILAVAADTAQFWSKDYDLRTARRIRGKDRHLDFMVTNSSTSVGSIRWGVYARLLLRA